MTAGEILPEPGQSPILADRGRREWVEERARAVYKRGYGRSGEEKSMLEEDLGNLRRDLAKIGEHL